MEIRIYSVESDLTLKNKIIKNISLGKIVLLKQNEKYFIQKEKKRKLGLKTTSGPAQFTQKGPRSEWAARTDTVRQVRMHEYLGGR